MALKARSARGVVVDFDLLKVKQSIADAPTIDVASREEFVERRIRRRTKRSDSVQPINVEPTPTALDVVDEPEEFAEINNEDTPTIQPVKPVKK